MKRLFLLLACAAIPLFTYAQEQSEPLKHMAPAGRDGYYTVEKAKVEQVFEAVEDGYQFIAYLVTWHGVHVIVSDPLSISAHIIGDEIEFMANCIVTPASPKPYKNISFTLIPHRSEIKATHK